MPIPIDVANIQFIELYIEKKCVKIWKISRQLNFEETENANVTLKSTLPHCSDQLN